MTRYFSLPLRRLFDRRTVRGALSLPHFYVSWLLYKMQGCAQPPPKEALYDLYQRCIMGPISTITHGKSRPLGSALAVHGVYLQLLLPVRLGGFVTDLFSVTHSPLLHSRLVGVHHVFHVEVPCGETMQAAKTRLKVFLQGTQVSHILEISDQSLLLSSLMPLKPSLSSA